MPDRSGIRNWLPLDTCNSITESTGTVCALGRIGADHLAGRAGAVETGLTVLGEAIDGQVFLRDVDVSDRPRRGPASSRGRSRRSTVITLVIAEVWLAGGLVPTTLPDSSGVDGEFACLNLLNPAAFSLLIASE